MRIESGLRFACSTLVAATTFCGAACGSDGGSIAPPNGPSADAGGMESTPNDDASGIGGEPRVEFVDIFAGHGAASGSLPSAVIDGADRKLLVATTNNPSSFKPSLFRCELDGTACTHADISAGQGGKPDVRSTIAIDTVNAKVLVAREGAVGGRPSLLRCELDGTACTHTDVSAGQGANSGEDATVLVDATNRKLLVVTTNGANAFRPALFRCELDGTACVYTDLSNDSGGLTDSPAAVVHDGKLLVATIRGTQPALYRCGVDGAGCGHVDLTADLPPGYSGGRNYNHPSVAVDPANGKLLVVTDNDDPTGRYGYMPNFFRCNLDGTACSHAIIAGDLTRVSFPAAIVHDGKLLVVASAPASSSDGTSIKKLVLFRCALDGEGCTSADISAGKSSQSGYHPSAVVDAVRRKLLVATDIGLFIVDL